MAKLKRKQENNKLSKLDVKMKCLFMNEHDTILFSFKYLTNQDNYNLKGFKGSRNFRDDIDVLNAFHDCLNRMSIYAMPSKYTSLHSFHCQTVKVPDAQIWQWPVHSV